MKKSNLCCVFVRQAATLGLGLGLLMGCATQSVKQPENYEAVNYDSIAPVTCKDTALDDCVWAEDYVNALGEKCAVVLTAGEKETFCRSLDGNVRKLKQISK